jgi:predicted DNA-binding transcriptional regulator YafY
MKVDPDFMKRYVETGHAMRFNRTREILALARALASSAEGLTLEEMCRVTDCGRRTVERMRDAIRDVFPQLEEIPDHPTKRFRIPRGLDGFFQDPTAEELSNLGIVVGQLSDTGATARASSLAGLEKKIQAAMRLNKRRTATDVEALLRAERIAVQPGPKPAEDPAMMTVLHRALLSMKMLRFVYHGGSRPGATRDVAPFGIIFGRTNYLIGADAGTEKPKHWRLDRIETPRCLDDVPAAPPADFDLAAFANTPFAYFEGPQEDVVLRVLPHGMEDFKNYRFHPSQSVEELPGGGAIVRFRASGMLELAWHLFSWGDKIEIIGPASLREQMLAELRGALAHHDARSCVA